MLQIAVQLAHESLVWSVHAHSLAAGMCEIYGRLMFNLLGNVSSELHASCRLRDEIILTIITDGLSLFGVAGKPWHQWLMCGTRRGLGKPLRKLSRVLLIAFRVLNAS